MFEIVKENLALGEPGRIQHRGLPLEHAGGAVRLLHD